LNAKIVEFTAQYSREEMLAITLGPVDSGRFRLWALVFDQGGRRITLAGREHPELTPVQIAISGLLATLTWEHPRERLPDIPKLAPRTVVYPMEIADIMELVKAGHYTTLSPEIELPCGKIAGLMSGWSQAVPFALLSHDEARTWLCLLSSPQLGFFLHLLLRTPPPDCDR
jgi:hypothetical protein